MTTTVHESSTPSSVESLKTKNTHNGFIRYVSLGSICLIATAMFMTFNTLTVVRQSEVVYSEATISLFNSWNNEPLTHIIASDPITHDCPDDFTPLHLTKDIQIVSSTGASSSLSTVLQHRHLCVPIEKASTMSIMTKNMMNDSACDVNHTNCGLGGCVKKEFTDIYNCPATNIEIVQIPSSCVSTNPQYCFDWLADNSSYQIQYSSDPMLPMTTKFFVPSFSIDGLTSYKPKSISSFSTSSLIMESSKQCVESHISSLRQLVGHSQELLTTLRQIGDGNSQLVKQLLAVFGAIIAYFAIPKDSQQMTIMAAILTSAGTLGYIAYDQQTFLQSPLYSNNINASLLSYPCSLENFEDVFILNIANQLATLQSQVQTSMNNTLHLVGISLLCMIGLIFAYSISSDNRVINKSMENDVPNAKEQLSSRSMLRPRITIH